MYLFTFISGFLLGYFVSNLNIREILRNVFDFSQIPNKMMFFGLLLITVLVFFLLIFLPIKMLLNNEKYFSNAKAENEENETKISARVELKRRGSWPVAYSNKVYFKYSNKGD